jgi:AraC-like DNA-binding protein
MLLPPARPQGGEDRALFWPPVLATWGPGEESDLHAHHAWQLLLALAPGTAMRARASRRGKLLEAAGILVAPDAPHAVDARGAEVLIVFVEPRSDVGARLRARAGPDVAPLDAVTVTELRARLAGHASTGAGVPALLDSLGAPLVEPARAHPAIRRVLRHLQGAPSGTDTSLAALAQVAGLSPGRFMHAFTATVGLPLRPYLLWHKLGRAAQAIAAGESLSAAARLAGFADAAHLTRTFRRMYGTSPSEARRRSQFVQERPG